MDSIYDPAEVYDAELLNDDDDNDDSKSDQDKGESDRMDDESMGHEDASTNDLLTTDSSGNIILDVANNDGDAVVEEDTDGNKERFSRTEGENKKVSVMQRLSPSIDSNVSRDSARGGKGNYSRLMVLNLPLSCSVDQLKEFINSKLDSGVTLDKLEGIYVGAAMVWITPPSAIGKVASSLQDCVLDDRKVVARKMSSRDYDVFAKKKSKALNEPISQNRESRGGPGPTDVLWRVVIRNINTSLNTEQLDSIFRKRAEGIVKVYMIADKTGGSGKKHSGRGYVTMKSRDLAARFCGKVGNSMVGKRKVVARMEPRPIKSPAQKSSTPARPAHSLPRPPHYRLTVTGVSVEVSAKELEEIFSSEVSSPVRAHLAPMAGAPHAGTGYLEFRKEEAAFTAHTLLNGTDIGGSCISLTLDIDKGSEPPDHVEGVADTSDVMEVTTEEPQQKDTSLNQRSRSRDSDVRIEREARSRREERDRREPERERRDQERDRRRPRDNDRQPRVRSRSPLRADRGESRRFEGVTIFRDMDELRRKTRGARFRAHVSNISYKITDGKMVTLVNHHVSGLESILSIQSKEGKFRGVMILEFVSPAAVENFIDKMTAFPVNDRRIVIKRDTDNSLRDHREGVRPRRSSPMHSRDDKLRPRDTSPMRLPQHMGPHPHMGTDQMVHPAMQMGVPMPSPMGHPSQMGGAMNPMISGMSQGINPAMVMAGGQQMVGSQQMARPALGLGLQMAGGFGLNRPISGVSTRLGDMAPQPGSMAPGTGFMPSQQQPQQVPVAVAETSQRQLLALPNTTGDASTETYGLSTAFLTSLNIKLPLVKELLVTNLDSAATEADLKDLFTIAGTVVKIQYNSVKGQAVVEMGHPVEAVQAVSMLHNQEYFDRTLGVRMLRPNDPDNLVTRALVPAVPRGLKTIGKGLGIDGLPLSTVMQQPPIAPPQQQQQQQQPPPQQSVMPDPCLQRPPPSKGSVDKPMFAYPPPPQMPTNTFPRRGQGAGTSKQGQSGSQPSLLPDTSRRTEKRTERASRWENSYQKTNAPNADTWGPRRDSSGVDRGRQDGANSSKNRFGSSAGDVGYSQPNTSRVADMPQRYGSADAKSNGSSRERNDSRGGEFNHGYGGPGRRDEQLPQASNSWLNDRTDLPRPSYGNQSESSRFSNNTSSNSGGGQGRASRFGWDDASHTRPVKAPNTFGNDDQNRNYSSEGQNKNFGFNRSGGFPSVGGASLNTSQGNFSDGSTNAVRRSGAGQAGSSLLGGYGSGGRGGGFGSEQVSGAPSTSMRSSIPGMMSSSNVGREVILSNLPSNAKQQTIVDLCLPYGVVRNVTLNSAQRSGRVVFDSYQQATMAADILNNQNYNGAVLTAMLA